MTDFIIREGDISEIESFDLYDASNTGDEILVAELDGVIVAYAQHDGAYVYFIESTVSGAGRALITHLQEQNDFLQAMNVGTVAAGFWMKMGFEKADATGERPGEFHYDWYKED